MSKQTSSVSAAKARPLLVAVLGGQAVTPPPIWLMRQAGRYLPEYRAVRAEAGSFLDLCYNPARAAEVTLQPIRRYGFDAAIVFSDILVVPDALGQEVRFVEGEGPRLDPIRAAVDLARLDPSRTERKLDLVYETIGRVKAELPGGTALIGFCGAPWTVATYMVGGQGSSDQAAARLWAYRDPDGFARLIDLLVDVSVDYLSGQVAAGADTVQIFDSWAGSLPESEFRKWVINPTLRLVREIKARHPGLPVIGFPRGAGVNAAMYASTTKVDGLGCDTATPVDDMVAIAKATSVAVQGNLDPLLLVSGGSELERQTRRILEATRGTPFIFNLGHGIVPETPPEHVARLVALVREHGA